MTAPLVPPRAGPGPDATTVLPVLPGPTPVTGGHRPSAGQPGTTPASPTEAPSASVFADLRDASNSANGAVEDLPHGSDPFAWLSTLAGLEAQPGTPTPRGPNPSAPNPSAPNPSAPNPSAPNRGGED